MHHSRLMSLAEAIANVAVGYGVAVALIVFPVFGIAASLEQNLAIGAVFTMVSLAPRYLLRRMFELMRG